jgi:HSP20 family molecular chaperone IbpA
MFTIPLDIYESPAELVIVMPLAGVHKDSLHLSMQEYRLVIKGERIQPELKDDLVALQEECFW